MAGIELTSSAFNDHAPIPPRHAREQDNVSPPLLWSGVPDSTSGLLLLCEDPDAPSGNFLHWLVAGIDPSSGGVEEGQAPTGGTPWTNSFGSSGWGGPHPPPGDTAHRYFFRLYALREPAELPREATPDDVHRAVEGKELASGTLVGLYQR